MDFRPDPPRPFGDLKNPRGHPAGPEGRSGGRSEARSAERRWERRPEGPAGCPRGFFKSPNGRGGSGRKSMTQNQNFVHIFLLFVGSNPKITNQALFNFKRFSKPIVSITASQLAYFIFFLSFGRNVFYKTFSFCR